MRLLMTTDTIGGVWTYTRELAEGLLAQHCELALVSMGRMPSADQQAWVDGISARWPNTFSYVPTGYTLEWMQDNTACYFESRDLLLQMVDDFCPDIFHSNQFCHGALPVKMPKIVVAHSDVLSWSANCRGAAPERNAWFFRYHTMVSNGLHRADAVVAPSRWMLEQAEYHYGPLRRGHVIGNGRTLRPRFSRGKKLQAVTAGRVWDEAKNIRLLEQVASPMPLLVAGDTDLEGASSFHSAKLNLLGPLPEEEVLDLFSASSIYIATSKYEPFGLAPLEAALCGCAILANDIPSLREIWGDAAVYFHDASSLSTALMSLASDPDALDEAAARASHRAHTGFTRSVMTSAYLDLYRSLVGSKQQEVSARNVA